MPWPIGCRTWEWITEPPKVSEVLRREYLGDLSVSVPSYALGQVARTRQPHRPHSIFGGRPCGEAMSPTGLVFCPSDPVPPRWDPNTPWPFRGNGQLVSPGRYRGAGCKYMLSKRDTRFSMYAMSSTDR